MNETSATESMKRVTTFAQPMLIGEFKQAQDELFKLSDDFKLVLSDLADRANDLRSIRMRITQECQLINASFDEMDRVFAGPRGQASSAAMHQFSEELHKIQSLLNNKGLRKVLKVLKDEEQ